MPRTAGPRLASRVALLLLAVAPRAARAPPIVTTTDAGYIGPHWPKERASPYRGRDHVFHLHAEVGLWELDHLLHSSEHTDTHIFVMFYLPRNRNCKRFLPVWDELARRFAGVPTVDVLKLDCSGNQAHACLDHNVQKFPTLQVFRPGLPHGEVLEAGVRADLYSLEQWVHTGIHEPGLRDAREVEPISGCVAFRRTRACDPHGDRERHKDRSCADEIQNGVEGFCECADDDHRYHVGCEHAPFSCRDVCVQVPGCAGWRQTGDCSPLGPREPHNDLHCQRQVPPGVSGFCECTDGRKVHESTCARTISFTCAEECAAPPRDFQACCTFVNVFREQNVDPRPSVQQPVHLCCTSFDMAAMLEANIHFVSREFSANPAKTGCEQVPCSR
jgi:hypothetical protein